jgi:hypothetical protein
VTTGRADGRRSSEKYDAAGGSGTIVCTSQKITAACTAMTLASVIDLERTVSVGRSMVYTLMNNRFIGLRVDLQLNERPAQIRNPDQGFS